MKWRFFRRTEPHSPMAYPAEKAVKWGDMPLHRMAAKVIKTRGPCRTCRNCWAGTRKTASSKATDRSIRSASTHPGNATPPPRQVAWINKPQSPRLWRRRMVSGIASADKAIAAAAAVFGCRSKLSQLEPGHVTHACISSTSKSGALMRRQFQRLPTTLRHQQAALWAQ